MAIPAVSPWQSSIPQQDSFEANTRPTGLGGLLRSIAQGSMGGVVDTAKFVQHALLRPYGFTQHLVPTRVGCVSVCETGTPGDGPTYVFVHGFASDGSDYGPLLRRMKQSCGHMVVVDLPGHGNSPMPTEGLTPEVLMTACEDALAACLKPTERCIFVGNSMGGLGVLRALPRFRGQVIGQVLMSPAGAPTNDAEMDALMRSFRLDNYDEALAFNDRLFINGNWLRYPYAAGMWGHVNRPHLQELLHAYRHEPKLTPADLADVPPTLLIWGDGDKFLPMSGRQFFMDALPAERTTVCTEPCFSHVPYLDQSGRLWQVMRAWALKHPGFLKGH